MKILSNDYASNVPGDTAIGHGGPALFAGAFSDFAAGRGHSWTGVVLRAIDGDGETSFREEARSDRKAYLAFAYPRPHLQAFMTSRKAIDPRAWFAPQIEALRKLIRHAKPDVLFLNGFSVFAWMLLETARLEGLPVVTQHAGIAQVEFEIYKHLYSAAARRAVLKMEQEIVQVAAKQVFLNAFSRDAFCERVAPVPKAQSVIIPLPYQKRFLAKAPVSRKKKGKGPVVIGCVARWDRIKNLDAFLRLAKEAGRRGLGWRFRAVTRIPETKIQKRFKDAFRKTIEIVPPMPPEELLAFYRSVDLLVLPSKFDVSPTVVMEATLQGKTTAISPTVGWVSEYRANGLRGAIVDFSDEAKALDRLRALLKKAPSEPFRRMVRVDHAPARVFAAYLRLFRSVV